MTEPVRKLDAHLWERETHDHYVEPQWVSKRLFDVEKFDGSIWDPACGFGRIPEAAKAAGHWLTYASDIVDRGYPEAMVGDFFDEDFYCYNKSCNIVTNPPFDVAEKFVARALEVTEKKVAVIFPTARLNAAHWARTAPLYRIWLLTPRPSMPPGSVIATGGKATGGKVDMCWLVFRHGFKGSPTVGWLHRDEGGHRP